ncbi:cobalamin biosynthesis protein CobD [Photobacterium carnosum]|uniref:adenosylcobinamide-phosphate synthase CbiB n=1 Tax=Photobacterium carnosum TaxID=2023717 RepID=UPI001E2D9D3F|nr:adenosylcobinamide-phosphate synthase CbiB [Photobacterium carnosum]MCD9522995.1 cobalamin biosynthesis protein CobD [Photobacterium carnosum]
MINLALEYWQPALVVATALVLDRCFGEVKKFHPLVGLGWLISKTEQRLYGDNRRNGVMAMLLLTLPWLLLYMVNFPWWCQAIVLYFVIGGRSLGEHGQAVAYALHQQDLPLARQKVSYIVSRKTAGLNEQQVVSATVESMLENGNDAVFGALFWFIVASVPGAIVYRVANTLDARWGYKNARWLHFGWAAARWDDLLNYLPARLTVLTYASLGKFRVALRCAWQQGRQCSSPNGGPVMAAGAGSLGVTIGGPAQYDGYQSNKPWLGLGPHAQVTAIEGAVKLVNRGAWLWLLILVIELVVRNWI